MVDGERLTLWELPDPNLATYTPTVVEHRPQVFSALDTVASDDFDPKVIAVTQDSIDGPLVAAERTSLTYSGEDLHLTATSQGHSLIVVPLEYSHCVELDAGPRPSTASIHRVDGILTGVLFERELDATLSFRTGPLRNPTCRFKDYLDFKDGK